MHNRLCTVWQILYKNKHTAVVLLYKHQHKYLGFIKMIMPNTSLNYIFFTKFIRTLNT